MNRGKMKTVNRVLMKLAAIDIGTNSIHMVITRLDEQRIFEIIDREKEMVFLGKGGMLKRRLTQDAMDRGLAAMLSFRGIADSHHVDQIIATATSAVRETANGREFIRLVRERTGIEIRVLSGKEEARLITLAVRDVYDLRQRRALIIDIGGGSMELIVADARNIYLSESLKAGVIRLSERFMRHDPPAQKDLLKLETWLSRKLDRICRRIQDLAPEVAIGTSGTILEFGGMVSSRKGNRSEFLSLSDLDILNTKLERMTLAERQKMPGLDRKRADQIVAGGILLETVLEKCRVNKLRLCENALREGLIADFLIRRLPSRTERKLQARELRGRSVLTLLDRWQIDREHADHSAKLSLQLFDTLAETHGFGPKERQMLEYAALLHDIGRVISYQGHHKHGWYIIRNSNLIGFRAREIDMLAAVTVYHRGKSPKKKDIYLQGLGRKRRQVVRVLSGILRIADSLDRQHNQTVRSIRGECPDRESAVIILTSAEPALIPLRAAAERSDLLQRALKLKKIVFEMERTQSEPVLADLSAI